jgi:hypothetical protein
LTEKKPNLSKTNSAAPSVSFINNHPRKGGAFKMSDPKHPAVGDMSIDASDITPADLTPDQIQHKTKVRAGFPNAVGALKRLSPGQIQTSGVNASEVQRALDLKVQYDRCDELLPPAEKLVELLHETKLEYGHQIGMILGEIAAQVRRRADRDPKAAEVLGTISDLLDYISAPGLKAVKTRTKKEEEQEVSPAPVKENGAHAPLVS